MAHQHGDGALNRKNSQKALNFVGIFALRGWFSGPQGAQQVSSNLSTTTHTSSMPSPVPPRRRCNPPFCVSFINFLADKQVSCVQKAWSSVCNAPPKQELVSNQEVLEPSFNLADSSLEVKRSHQNKLEALPSLGKHILLYFSEKSPLKGHVLLHAENSPSCTFESNADGFQRSDDGSASSFVGVFLQTHTKDGVHLAQRLVDGGSARRGLHSFAFARLRGEPGMICANSSQPQVEFDEAMGAQQYKESTPLQLASSHRLTLRSFKEQILQVVPQQQQQQQQQNFPDKEMLNSVQDFFMYTEFEGRKVFDELDRDADGKLTLDDLKVAMKKMKLPVGYAKDFMQRRHWLWSAKFFGWSDFSSLLQEKEPVIVQLFNSLGVSKSGTVKKLHVKDSLMKAGLSASEANVTAMMKFLAEDVGDGLKYGQFRRFMLLLPTERLTQDPWSVWLKAATTTHGVEPLSEDLRLPILNPVTLLSRNLSHHFDLAKQCFSPQSLT